MHVHDILSRDPDHADGYIHGTELNFGSLSDSYWPRGPPDHDLGHDPLTARKRDPWQGCHDLLTTNPKEYM